MYLIMYGLILNYSFISGLMSMCLHYVDLWQPGVGCVNLPPDMVYNNITSAALCQGLCVRYTRDYCR